MLKLKRVPEIVEGCCRQTVSQIDHGPGSGAGSNAPIATATKATAKHGTAPTPPRIRILRMLTHMSLMRDPRAPFHVPDDVFAALFSDLYIVDLERQRAQLKAKAYKI
jgi:hypothetical protein